ncbi:MAG: ATP-binding protein [Microgenomates group bacterium]
MEISQLTEQNPWWEDRKKIEEDEKVREALSKKHKLLPHFKEGNFLIIGPRQVGKTTYLKLILKRLLDKGTDPKRLFYFSCEPLVNFEEIIEIVRFSDSLIKGKKYFFFDEITFVNDWQRAIKYILDSDLKKEKVFYISGSSSVALKKETFPGRLIKTENFLPLSFKEFCLVFGSENLKKTISSIKIKEIEIEEIYRQAKGIFFFYKEISDLFNIYLRTGGFPRSFYQLIEGEGISEETYEVYWKWLVSDIAKIERSERISRAVLISILKNYGTKFSLNSIAKEMEIGSHITIREYLEILENLFVLRNIFPFDFRKKTELFRKARKVYFIDPFLFHVFKKTLTKQSVEEEEVPKIVEGIVGEYLIRKFGNAFYFSGKKEIDFVGEKMAIEVKWQKKVGFQDFGKVRLSQNILLSKSNFDFSKKEKILILPVSLFLLC